MDDHEQQKCLSSGMLSECHSHQREENLLNERGNLTSDHNATHILSITLSTSTMNMAALKDSRRNKSGVLSVLRGNQKQQLNIL